jgi:hypothetical protein
MLCAGWRCGGVKVLPLLGGFPVRCISSISPRFYFKWHAFCFHPLAAILESLSYIFNNMFPQLSRNLKETFYSFCYFYFYLSSSFIYLFFWLHYFVILQFELSASFLEGRCSNKWALSALLHIYNLLLFFSSFSHYPCFALCNLILFHLQHSHSFFILLFLFFWLFLISLSIVLFVFMYCCLDTEPVP